MFGKNVHLIYYSLFILNAVLIFFCPLPTDPSLPAACLQSAFASYAVVAAAI